MTETGRTTAIGSDSSDSSSERFEVLDAFSRALRRESHNIFFRPDLLWQQLCNRLQWEGKPVQDALEPELALRSSSRAHLWIKTETGFSEAAALKRTIVVQGGWINGCRFSPDGTLLASPAATPWQHVGVWETETGREFARLTGHEAAPTVCTFGCDGSYLISGGLEPCLRFWDLRSGKQFAKLSTKGFVNCLDISRDGLFLVVGTESGVFLWDTETRTPGVALEGGEKAVTACSVSPDGSLIVGSFEDGSLALWETETGNRTATLCGHTAAVATCVFSPDGAWIISDSRDETVRVWDTRTSEALRVLQGPPALPDMSTLAMSPCGCLFAAGAGLDLGVNVWDATSGELVAVLEGHSAPTSGCAFSPDGALLVSSSFDGTLKIWEVARIGEQSAADADRMISHSPLVFDCDFAPDGESIVTAGQDGKVKIWDIESLCEKTTIESGEDTVRACAFSPYGNLVVFAGGPMDSGSAKSANHEIVVWDIAEDERRDPDYRSSGTVGHDKTINDCAVSPDGSFIASASNDFSVRLWSSDFAAPQIVLEGHTSAVSCCAIGPDGTLVASAGWDLTVRLWEAESSTELATMRTGGEEPALPFGPHLLSCAMSPEGSFLVTTAQRESFARVWDIETRQEQAKLTGAGLYYFSDCAISPDGHLIAAVADDGLRVWDASTAQELALLNLPHPPVTIAFHPFRPLLACGCAGGAVILAKLEGIAYGPLVVTPVDFGGGRVIRCPYCNTLVPFRDDWLGKNRRCPREGCGLLWKVNPFVCKRPSWATKKAE